MAFSVSDSKASAKPWAISISAKAEGLVTAELRVASPEYSQKTGFFSFFRMKRRSSMRQQSEGVICDCSLRIRARLFFFRAKVAAGRLCELNARTRQYDLIHYKSSGKAPPPAVPPFRWFKKGSSCPSSLQMKPSFFSMFFPSKRQRKGSFLVCGAGAGAFVFCLLHHATSWATHIPAFAWNAGSRLIGLFATFFHRKCNSAGFKGAACFWRGVRGAMSLFKMIMSMVSPIISGRQFVSTVLLTLFIGLLLTGRASKLQDLLYGSKTQGGARALKLRMLRKLFLTMQLIKCFWAHIGMKRACVLLLVLAFLTNAISGLEEMT